MTSLTLVRRIKARPSIVFDALTTPEGIAFWWGPDEGPVLVAETDPRVRTGWRCGHNRRRWGAGSHFDGRVGRGTGE